MPKYHSDPLELSIPSFANSSALAFCSLGTWKKFISLNKSKNKKINILKGKTQITLPDYGDSFTGTPGEIDFQLDNIRQSRKFLYNAGLTNLQGTIDKENTALRTEGAKDVAKIGEQGGLYRGLVGSFNFS